MLLKLIKSELSLRNLLPSDMQRKFQIATLPTAARRRILPFQSFVQRLVHSKLPFEGDFRTLNDDNNLLKKRIAKIASR